MRRVGASLISGVCCFTQQFTLLVWVSVFGEGTHLVIEWIIPDLGDSGGDETALASKNESSGHYASAGKGLFQFSSGHPCRFGEEGRRFGRGFQKFRTFFSIFGTLRNRQESSPILDITAMSAHPKPACRGIVGSRRVSCFAPSRFSPFEVW